MICPLLTYADMQQAMAELAEVFQLQIVSFGNNVAEIRWNGGVAVAQADEPEALHGSHTATAGPTYESTIPMRTTRQHSAVAVTSSTNHTLTPTVRSAATAPVIGRATSGPSDPTRSAAKRTSASRNNYQKSTRPQ